MQLAFNVSVAVVVVVVVVVVGALTAGQTEVVPCSFALSVPESPLVSDGDEEGEGIGKKSETGPACMYPSGAAGIVDVI